MDEKTSAQIPWRPPHHGARRHGYIGCQERQHRRAIHTIDLFALAGSHRGGAVSIWIQRPIFVCKFMGVQFLRQHWRPSGPGLPHLVRISLPEPRREQSTLPPPAAPICCVQRRTPICYDTPSSRSDYSTYEADDLLPLLFGEDNTTQMPTVEFSSERPILQVIRRNAFGQEFSTSFTRM